MSCTSWKPPFNWEQLWGDGSIIVLFSDPPQNSIARSRDVLPEANCCSHSSSCLPRWSGYDRRSGDKGTMKGEESRARQRRQIDGGVGAHLSGCGERKAHSCEEYWEYTCLFFSLKASPEDIHTYLAWMFKRIFLHLPKTVQLELRNYY